MFRIITAVAFSLAFSAFQCLAGPPRLIVAISLDQFRYDYVQRFRPYFGQGGFRYLLDHGANFSNASYKHATNTTGPGHASMLSGAYANSHGIITNDWYDRNAHKTVYCVEDTTTTIVGSGGKGRSPRNFNGSTLGDELRLKTGFHAKVISLSNKDRAAILMGGKLANGAFWMADSVFVTSTYYMNELPAWVRAFNRSGILDSYFGKVWTKMLPDSVYALMDVDNAGYEKNENNQGRTFPHKITGKESSRITHSYYSAMWSSPFAAKALAALAKHAVEGEQLGQHRVTDMLCLSFSSTDGVGHAFGPHSQEVMDMALQMDAILADFFSFLDGKIGLQNCVIVLTADHGVAPIPEFILSHVKNADVGRIPHKDIEALCSSILSKRFPGQDHKNWIENIEAQNIYLNHTAFNGPELESAAQVLADSLRTLHAIAAAYTAKQLRTMAATNLIESKMQRSFNPPRSGDVVYALRPFWLEGDSGEGASHGQPYDYDAHVPVIIVADGIRKGEYATEASPVDIAPTLSSLLGIEFPAGREGRVLTEALKTP